MSVFSDYVQAQATNKKKTTSVWLQDVLKKIPKCTFSTHVGKFTHPDSKVNYYDTSKLNYPYVMTATVPCEVDISVSTAAYLGTARLLLLHLEDDRPVWQHFVTGDDLLQTEITSFQGDYATARADLLQVLHVSENTTEGKLRQVYFPIDTNDYHLLTVLPASSLLFSLKGQLKQWQQEERESSGSYQKINPLTEISFGGSKPRNISTLNADQAGLAYLLTALPPVLEQREVVYPKRNFYRESVPTRLYRRHFLSLLQLAKSEKKNCEVRKKRESLLQNILDVLWQVIYTLRTNDNGWTKEEKYSQLPGNQKILLDDAYEENRRNDDWQESISSTTARWFVWEYEFFAGKQKIVLGDTEFHYVQEEMKKRLQGR